MTPRCRGLPIRLCLPTLQSILCIRHRPHLGSSALMRWHFALCFRQPSHERRCCAGWIEKLPPRSSWKTSGPLGDIILREADMDETRDAISRREIADGWLRARKSGGCFGSFCQNLPRTVLGIMIHHLQPPGLLPVARSTETTRIGRSGLGACPKRVAENMR